MTWVLLPLMMMKSCIGIASLGCSYRNTETEVHQSGTAILLDSPCCHIRGMLRSKAVTSQSAANARGPLRSDQYYTMRNFDLILLRQKKFVLNLLVSKSTSIKNTKCCLNNLFLQQPTEPYINYVKPQLKST